MQRTVNFLLGKNPRYLDNAGIIEKKELNDESYFIVDGQETK